MNNEVIFMRVFAEKSSLQCLMALRLAGAAPVTQQRFTLYTDLDRSTVRRGLARLASMGMAARGGSRANPNWQLTPAAQQMITQLFSAPPAAEPAAPFAPVPAPAAEPASANVGAAHRGASRRDRGRPRHGAPSRSDRASPRSNRAAKISPPRAQPATPPSTGDSATADSAPPVPPAPGSPAPAPGPTAGGGPPPAPRHREASPSDREASPSDREASPINRANRPAHPVPTRAAKKSPSPKPEPAVPPVDTADSASATLAPVPEPAHLLGAAANTGAPHTPIPLLRDTPSRSRSRDKGVCGQRILGDLTGDDSNLTTGFSPFLEEGRAAWGVGGFPAPQCKEPTFVSPAPAPRHRGASSRDRAAPRSDRAASGRDHAIRAAKKSPHAVRAIQSAMIRADQPEPGGGIEELNIDRDIYTDSPPRDPETARQLRAAVRAGGVFPTLRTPLIEALLVDDGPAWVRHALGWICHVRRDSPKAPIGGIVYPMLSQRRLCDDEYLPPPDMTFDEALAWALNGGPDPEPPEPDWGDDDGDDPPTPPEPPRPPTPEEALWQNLLARVKLEVKRDQYEMFLTRTRLLQLSADACTVGAPNNWVRNVLVHRLDSTVQRHVAALLGRQVKVSYECMAQE